MGICTREARQEAKSTLMSSIRREQHQRESGQERTTAKRAVDHSEASMLAGSVISPASMGTERVAWRALAMAVACLGPCATIE